MNSDIVLDTKTAPTSRRESAAALGGFTWFEASTAVGALRLCTFADDAAENAVDAALVLSRYEPLLVALEAWTALELDWRWCAIPPSQLPAASHACARWRPHTNGDAILDPIAKKSDCLLELPWELLRSLVAPTDKVDLLLHWLSVPVALAIARFKLAVSELSQLEPGGAVVLPDSLQQHWHGRLRCADEPVHAGVPVALPSPWAPRLAKPFVGSDCLTETSLDVSNRVSDGGIACEVRLATPRSMAGDRLTGWFECDLPEAQPNAELWRCATELEPATLLASGQLMPWGDGWVLGLEAVPIV